MPARDPAVRSQVAEIGAHSLHAQYDSRELSAPARAASPGSDAYWLQQVDPDNQLDPIERERRAHHAKVAHFKKLALRSAQVRRKKVP